MASIINQDGTETPITPRGFQPNKAKMVFSGGSTFTRTTKSGELPGGKTHNHFNGIAAKRAKADKKFSQDVKRWSWIDDSASIGMMFGFKRDMKEAKYNLVRCCRALSGRQDIDDDEAGDYPNAKLVFNQYCYYALDSKLDDIFGESNAETIRFWREQPQNDKEAAIYYSRKDREKGAQE